MKKFTESNNKTEQIQDEMLEEYILSNSLQEKAAILKKAASLNLIQLVNTIDNARNCVIN